MAVVPRKRVTLATVVVCCGLVGAFMAGRASSPEPATASPIQATVTDPIARSRIQALTRRVTTLSGDVGVTILGLDAARDRISALEQALGSASSPATVNCLIAAVDKLYERIWTQEHGGAVLPLASSSARCQ